MLDMLENVERLEKVERLDLSDFVDCGDPDLPFSSHGSDVGVTVYIVSPALESLLLMVVDIDWMDL